VTSVSSAKKSIDARIGRRTTRTATSRNRAEIRVRSTKARMAIA
jgi:hypothetical protein